FSCVPTAPVVNTKLLDVELVEEYRHFQLKDGVSGHGFVQVQHMLGACLQPDYGGGLCLDDADLQTAAHVYGQWLAEAEERMLKLLRLTPEPLLQCFICRRTSRKQLNDGTLLPAYLVAIMADATAKPIHFSSAGRQQRDIEPWSAAFLGEVARRVLVRFHSGELTSEAQQRYECAAADSGGDDSCSSSLTCSRASASARGMLDFAGLSGLCCTHCIPLRNCFVAMPAPEQWAFHIAAVAEALSPRPDIRQLYIDIACRIRAALLAELQKLTEGAQALLLEETVEQLRVMVTWMHGFDHSMACQKEFSGLYQERAGRHAGGEQMEWIWARGKPLFLLARYMTPARWWDTINAFLAFLTRQLQAELPGVLEKRLAGIDKTIDAAAEALEELTAEAAEHGVADLAAALTAVDNSTEQAAAALTKEAQYVELLVQLRSQQHLRKEKAGLSLLGNQ
ncbi:hypothetical protein ABPG75_009177, partial [Micractinium tetrahymenae]